MTALDNLWVSKLLSGGKTWKQVPAARQATVKAALKEMVAAEKLTPERYKEITGVRYVAAQGSEETAEDPAKDIEE